MVKTDIKSIAEKNRIAYRIAGIIREHKTFLLLGHQNPDTDCIASLVAVALLLNKLQREAIIFLDGPVMEQFNYLLAICRYNNIPVLFGGEKGLDAVDAVLVVDTPKRDMVAVNAAVAALLDGGTIPRIEIDHHLAADAQYIGDEGLCLVSEASSTCELIGYFSLKIARLMGQPRPAEFFSRNIALAILTGIVGDSHLGKFLKSPRERFFYRLFSEIFDRLLLEKTRRGSGNLSSMEAIFDEIRRFSLEEKHCFDSIMERRQLGQGIHYTILGEEDSAAYFRDYGVDLMVNVSKAAADTLGEESGKLGMVVYYDDPEISDFVQFRLRRSASYTALDLRDLLEALKIVNGGGHPGAVGFRFKKAEVPNLESLVQDLVARIGVFAQ